MKIVVALGNPGEKYKRSRHNAGRILIDEVFSDQEWRKENVFECLLASATLQGEEFLLVKPETYMNHSGRSVKKLLEHYNIPPKDLIVVYDDIDLPIGRMRISRDRSSGGHNGLESIISELHTKEFVRLRIGIAPTTLFGTLKKPQGSECVSRFVLADFKKGELSKLEKLVPTIKKALEAIVTQGTERAMNMFN